jgi:ACS family hexuronate transporter-like MFS transporter
VLLEMFFAMFVIVGFIVPAISYATYVYKADHAGLIAGIGAGSYGAIVALTMPLFGKLFDLHRYDIAFGVAALLPAVGFAGWAWINGSVTRARPLE